MLPLLMCALLASVAKFVTELYIHSTGFMYTLLCAEEGGKSCQATSAQLRCPQVCLVSISAVCTGL